MERAIGDWLPAAILTYDDNGNDTYQGREHFAAQEENDMERMFDVTFRFLPNGTCEQLMPIPAGVTPQQVEAEGCELRENGMFLLESQPWREEGGRLWIETGETSVDDDGNQRAVPYEITFEGDLMAMQTFKLRRK